MEPSTSDTPAKASYSPGAPTDNRITRIAGQITVHGDLVHPHWKDLKVEALDAMAEKANPVTIRFASRTYVDSSAIGVLVSLARIAKEHGVQLILAGVPKETHELLVSTGLAPFFTFEDLRP